MFSGLSIARRFLAPYRGLGMSLWSMFFATMINRFGDFVGAFLALYLSRILGYDAIRTGATISLVFAASMAGSLVSGRLADVIGRKRTLLLAQSGSALGNLLLAFLWSRPWASLLIAGGALFAGGARPLIGALLTDLSPRARRKEVFGLQYWSINVGVALGPLVAAFLFDHAIPLLFAGNALCTLASVSLIAKGVHLPALPPEASGLERHDDRGALRAFLARPVLLAFAALALANSLTYSQTGFALPLTVSAAFGADGPRTLGWLISLNALIVIVLSIPTARLLRSISPLLCMALSGAFYVVGFGMLAFRLGPAGFAVSTIVWTVGEVVASTNMGVFLARHSPANWRGSFQSFMGFFFSGGWTLGPLVAGPLIAAGGSSTLWMAAAAGSAIWGIAAVYVDRLDRRVVPAEQG
ncbi:MAG: MFS transporter [Spirochaetota bacterium]